MEQHLTESLSNRQLAQIVGYSEYHFIRVFKEVVNLTPAEYLRKRRITEVVRQMGQSHRPISELAFAYGFNSKENFIRAFKTEHAILPTEFRSAHNSLKLYDRPQFDTDALSPKVERMMLEPFTLVVYPSEEAFPPQFWNRYNVKHDSSRLSGGAVVPDYGVSDWNVEKQQLDYYIGIRETDAKGDRTGTVTLQIPGGLYAVFDTPAGTHLDFVQTIHRTWAYISAWLLQNGYQRTGGYEFEMYTESSRTFTERIFIPIQKGSDKDEAIDGEI